LSEAEKTQAQELARRLSIRLQSDPNDPTKIHPEYEKVAFLPALLLGGEITVKGAMAGLALIYGAAKAYELTGGPAKTAEAVKGLFGTAETKPDGQEPLRIPPGMTREQSQVYYQGLRSDLVDLWTRPLFNSRGNAETREGNDIVVQECLDVMKTEFPDLVGIIDHIGGATVRGEGDKNVTEKHLHGQNKANPRGEYSRPDVAFGGMFGEDGIFAYINTASQTIGGDLIKREAVSLARLMVNAGRAFVEAMDEDFSYVPSDQDSAAPDLPTPSRTAAGGVGQDDGGDGM
jgi:hypothetical protein